MLLKKEKRDEDKKEMLAWGDRAARIKILFLPTLRPQKKRLESITYEVGFLLFFISSHLRLCYYFFYHLPSSSAVIMSRDRDGPWSPQLSLH